MACSLKKGSHVDLHLLKKVNAVRANNDKRSIKTRSRYSTILPDFIGLTIAIHNGRVHVSVSISDSMVGRKLGEPSLTHTFKGHLTDKKAKRE